MKPCSGSFRPFWHPTMSSAALRANSPGWRTSLLIRLFRRVKVLAHRKKNKCVRALATLPRLTPTFGTSQHAQEESYEFYDTISYFANNSVGVHRSLSPEKSTRRHAWGTFP